MDEVAVARESIQPFWRKIKFFLKFPLKAGPFTFLIFMTVLAGSAAFIGFWVKAVLLVFFLRYAFSVMEMGSRGRFDPNSFDIPVWGTGDKRPLKQTVLFFFYGVILSFLASLAGWQKQTAPVAAPTPAISAIASAPALVLASTPTALASTATSAVASANTGEATLEEDDKDDDENERTTQERAASSAAASGSVATRTASAQTGDEEPDATLDSKQKTYTINTGKSGLWTSVIIDPDRHLPPLFFLLAILCALPLPASVMVIAIDNSLWRALNLKTFFFFVKAMGRAYFVLWIFFALIFLGREGVLQLFSETWSPLITAPLEIFFTFYLLLALYSMMGYALYQFHQELGGDVHVDFEAHLANEAKSTEMQTKRS